MSTPATTEQPLVGFTRCGVCKVDLKGRFVFVDDRAEKLLGASKEETIGRPLIDFLDETSRQLVVTLFNHRNHYETFYDAINIVLRNRHGELTTLTAIVSLNFIAGNPVNFQFIFTPAQHANNAGAVAGLAGVEAFCTALSAEMQVEDWTKRLSLILDFASASQALVYAVEQSGLELRGVAQQNAETDTPFGLAPGTADLHVKVAETGQEFSFADPWPYPETLQNGEKLPVEYVRVLLAGDKPLLLRVIWQEELSAEKGRTVLQEAKFAATLLERLLGGSTTQTAIGMSPDDLIRQIISTLDMVEVGACQIRKDGRIVQHNTALVRMFRRLRPNSSYQDIAKLLRTGNSVEAAHALTSWFASKTSKTERPLRCEVDLPGGRPGVIHAFKLSHQEYDHSAFLLFSPAQVESFVTESVA